MIIKMKVTNILLISSIIILILGLIITFIPTEIQITLLGVSLLALGVFGLIAYAVYKGPPQ